MLNPEAAFDVLTLHRSLDDLPNGMSHGETHLLLYLSCLLALYRGRPVSEWGYGFVRTQWGTPFSEEVATATQSLTDGLWLREGASVFRLTPSARELAVSLSTQQQFSWRLEFLEAASSTALALPLGTIREALHTEPSLRAAAAFQRTAVLMQEYTLHQLYDQFNALSEALGVGVNDLLVPSTVWLSYLLEIKRREAFEHFDAAA